MAKNALVKRFAMVISEYRRRLKMNNIDVFDQCTAHIFSTLYESFPVPVDLDYSEPSVEIFDEEESADVAFDKLVIFEKSILWLNSAGYLNIEAITYDGAHNVVLTAKGLEVLKLPSSLEVNGPSFGEKIVSSIKSGALKASGEAAKLALSKGLALVVGNT